MVFIIQLETYVTNISILSIIICKFHYLSNSSSVIMLKVDKGSKISFYNTILLFSLTVSLKVEYGRQPAFYITKVAMQKLKLWGK